MYDNSCYFEPTFTLNGIPISARRCQAIIAQWKAEALFAVTHLALLGVKRQEPAFRVTKEKNSPVGLFFSYLPIYSSLFYNSKNVTV